MKINLTPEENLILNALANSKEIKLNLSKMIDYWLFKFKVKLEIDGQEVIVSFSYRNKNGQSLLVPDFAYDIQQKSSQLGFYPDAFIDGVCKTIPDFFDSYLEFLKIELAKVPMSDHPDLAIYGTLDKLNPMKKRKFNLYLNYSPF